MLVEIASVDLQLSYTFEQVPHLAFFCFQVGAGHLGNTRLARYALDDANTRAFELANFFRVIGKQANSRCPKFSQNLRGELVIDRVSREPQESICFTPY